MRCSAAGLLLRFLVVALAWVTLRAGPPPAPTQAPEPLPALTLAVALPIQNPCPEGMLLVDGDYCDQVEETCLRERPKPHLGCLEFAQPTTCTGTQTPMRFCIDEYEFPNQAGEKPTVMQSWYDADRTCRSLHKRVCRSHEWTLACEGPDRLPYPYGYLRDNSACHIDEYGPMIDEAKFYSADQAKELERIDRREPSGAREGCVSPYGVHDLTGNVDEWTTNETGIPDHGVLKGGNWGEWRNACRPMTNGHASWFRYYQTGFRCCTDAGP